MQIDWGSKWNYIHLLARSAKTPAQKKQFIDYMKKLSNELPCHVCRDHFIEYLRSHPIESVPYYQYKGEDLTMFGWSWILHNGINVRLGKQQVQFDDALRFYPWNASALNAAAVAVGATSGGGTGQNVPLCTSGCGK